MYFPNGWPRKLLSDNDLLQVSCDRVKILFAVLGTESLAIWYSNKPCVPIVAVKRNPNCLTRNGQNKFVEWKPDSTKLGVVTEGGTLLIYDLKFIDTAAGVYNQMDSPQANLRRDSAELFVKEKLPSLALQLAMEIQLFVPITSIVCVTISQMMIATRDGKIKRYNWSGAEERDYHLELNRVPFSVNQQVNTASPIFDNGVHVTKMDYSPLIGGFAIALNDGRAAFLTAPNLKFDPNQVQGIWAPTIDDATTVSINHKYRLIAVGRRDSQVSVFSIDELTGGLELSHSNVLSSRDFPSNPGPVRQIKWTPEGAAMVCSWNNGGFSVWSTFGSLLTCSLGWDYGLTSSALHMNILNMDWSCEGYQLIFIRQTSEESATELLQLDFVKSALTINPCTSLNPFLLLQGDDKIFINYNETLETYYIQNENQEVPTAIDDLEVKSIQSKSFLSASKLWVTIPIPTAYTNANWPVRFSSLDATGSNLVVSGRTGIAIYSLPNRKWKLFGNESQEKDFVVTGGLVWWNEFVVCGTYNLTQLTDEIRVYSRDQKLDNKFGRTFEISAPVMLMSMCENQLIAFTADGMIAIYYLRVEEVGEEKNLELARVQVYNIQNICLHPAFVVSIFLTNLKHDSVSQRFNPSALSQPAETVVVNVAGRILMLQRESNNGSELMPTCLASCVECVWFFANIPSSVTRKLHLQESMWLYCGCHGMRVWLPVFPRSGEDNGEKVRHTFMARRIMLSFDLKIYPLAVSFEDAIIFGTETDTVMYMNDPQSHFAFPFCTLKRTSQVYLHQILKQLIKRNLGYNAWEIARSCASLPYFPHSLELLLHEVLEQEATSKDPIPDALLPSVIEFIQEFPVYLQTIVQCARKTEIALWPYLFTTAGKPKDLFQQCMATRQLQTATNYLIILQNLESSAISKQYATLLLDAALEDKNWGLSHDLVRFLKAIDPNDNDSPRNSFILGGGKFSSNVTSLPVLPDAEDLSLILSHMGPRTPRNSFGGKNYKRMDSRPSITETLPEKPGRSASPKVSKVAAKASQEDQFIDPILFKHLKSHLEQLDFLSLGHMSAALDIGLVAWLSREKDKEKLPRIDDFVTALKKLHEVLEWAKPRADLDLHQELQGTDSSSPLMTTVRSNKESKDSGYSSVMNPMVVPLSGNEDTASIISEITSIWEEPEESQPIIYLPSAQRNSKLEVKMRYLLQIFTEANCLDFSLLLSVLLLDSPSVNRVCTAAMKSASLSVCRQLKHGLTDLTRWSFNECLGYRSFMLSCSEDLRALDKFVATQESIPDLGAQQTLKVFTNEAKTVRKLMQGSMSASSKEMEMRFQEQQEKKKTQHEQLETIAKPNAVSQPEEQAEDSSLLCAIM